MRKECKVAKTANIASVQGYHQGGYGHGQAYAMMGFKNGFNYYNSDRCIPVIDGKRKDNGPMLCYGLEIETECSRITDDTVLAEIYDKIIFQQFKFPEMFKMQADGSLGGKSSAECITQLMTKARIRNDYTTYKMMFNQYFPALGIKADSYTTQCGMHVNVSNEVFGDTVEKRETAIRKLYYIINRHYDFCCKLFYRSPARTTWCGQMYYGNARTLDLHSMPNDHGKCFNGSHYDAGRIEIRLVGGQKDFGCFRNTMESVFFLCDRVKSISWDDCDKIDKIFKGCNQYVFDRLKTRCDLSSEIIEAIRPTVKREDLV